MKTKATVLAIAALTVVLTSSVAPAAEKTSVTTISIKGLHCEHCAKKLCDVLDKVQGVDRSVADAKKGVAIVAPAKNVKLPSPRAQWEAVEKAGYKPLRLAGPYGMFTSKPRF